MAEKGDDRTQTADERRRSATADLVQPYLFLALNGAAPRAGGTRWSLAGIHRVVVGRGPDGSERLDDRGRGVLRICIDDGQISREHLRLERDGTRFVAADLGSRNGTRVDGRELPSDEGRALRDGAHIALGRAMLVFRQAPPLPRAPAVTRPSDLPAEPALATLSPLLTRELTRLVRVVRRLRPAVLLRGPTGSGKEVVARLIHDELDRGGSFVAVNCAAIPPNLVEAELFGARRGAFSGAENRDGLVRAAHGGTLFLDEVADLQPTAQAALLRVLETREVLALGATAPVAVDVAVISATHRDLEAMMAAGELRRDLYARLAGFELSLPPLVERSEDLGLLIARFLAEMNATEASLSAEASEALMRHDWPLNIRELKAAIQTAAALAADAPIELADLPPAVREPTTPAASDADPRDDRLRAQLVEVLGRHGGNVAAVARELGKHRRQIHRWLDRLDLDPDLFRPH